jgi:hypothetical protein
MQSNSRKSQEQYFFQAFKDKWVSAWDCRRNMYCTGTSHAYRYCTEVQSETIFLMNPAGSHTQFWSCYFLWQMWKHLQISAFYWQHLQGHIWRTTQTSQNPSYHYTQTQFPDLIHTLTRHFNWWVLHLMAGPPILPTVPSAEIITVQNTDIWIVWIKLWLFVVLHNLYWKGDNFGVTPHFKRHQKRQQ